MARAPDRGGRRHCGRRRHDRGAAAHIASTNSLPGVISKLSEKERIEQLKLEEQAARAWATEERRVAAQAEKEAAQLRREEERAAQARLREEQQAERTRQQAAAKAEQLAAQQHAVSVMQRRDPVDGGLDP